MAEDIKKAFIFNDQLGKVDGNNNSHIRFRIATDDLSRVSSWSPFYEIQRSAVSQVDARVAYLSMDDSMMITWGDENSRPEYDIFVKWYINGSWDTSYVYHGTSPIHTYSMLIEKRTISSTEYTATKAKIIIQVASYKQERSYPIEIYPRDGGLYTEEFALV